VASMAELKQIYDELQRLGSRIDVLEESMRGVRHDMSAPTNLNGAAAPVEAVDLSGLEERLLKLEVAAAKGKPGRKPKHVQEAIEAEAEEAA